MIYITNNQLVFFFLFSYGELSMGLAPNTPKNKDNIATKMAYKIIAMINP